MHQITDMLSDADKAKAFSKAFAEGFLVPAFGSRSKGETDLLVLSALIEAGLIDPAAPLYDLSRLLNITPARVRGLIFNWQLRNPDLQIDLSEALRGALQKTRFSKDGTLLTFGIESPLLKEEIIARLKEKGVFADATFSKEIVRMPVDAFVEFLETLLTAEVKEGFVKRLVADKQIPDRSFKALATGVLGKLGEKVAGKAGDAIAEGVVGAVGSVAERLGGFITGLLGWKPDEAVKKLSKDDYPY